MMLRVLYVHLVKPSFKKLKERNLTIAHTKSEPEDVFFGVCTLYHNSLKALLVSVAVMEYSPSCPATHDSDIRATGL